MGEMDLKTAIAILTQQAIQLGQFTGELQGLSNLAASIIDQENSVTAVNPQIHALTATMGVIMTAINSQDIIVQQAIDKVAELSNT